MANGTTVLLVDDEETLLRLMTEQLEVAGYEVLPARSCDAAWILIEGGVNFDVLVTDLLTPGTIDGIELVRRLAKMRPGAAAILLSGKRADDTDLPAVWLGKPCPPSVLLQTLERIRPGSPTETE